MVAFHDESESSLPGFQQFLEGLESFPAYVDSLSYFVCFRVSEAQVKPGQNELNWH